MKVVLIIVVNVANGVQFWTWDGPMTAQMQCCGKNWFPELWDFRFQWAQHAWIFMHFPDMHVELNILVHAACISVGLTEYFKNRQIFSEFRRLMLFVLVCKFCAAITDWMTTVCVMLGESTASFS